MGLPEDRTSELLQPPGLSEVISFLCPTRGRPEMLRASIDSVMSTASHPENITFFCYADNDDLSYTDERYPQTVFLTGPRQGYARLHVYYNELCAYAYGTPGWRVVWNDDALMTTQGWDDVVASYDNKMVILSPQTVFSPICTFPIFPKQLYDLLGHVSLNAHNDTWLEEVGRGAGILHDIDVWVHHDRFDVTGANNDATFQEREYQTDEFNEMRPLREQDIAKVVDFCSGKS